MMDQYVIPMDVSEVEVHPKIEPIDCRTLSTSSLLEIAATNKIILTTKRRQDVIKKLNKYHNVRIQLKSEILQITQRNN